MRRQLSASLLVVLIIAFRTLCAEPFKNIDFELADPVVGSLLAHWETRFDVHNPNPFFDAPEDGKLNYNRVLIQGGVVSIHDSASDQVRILEGDYTVLLQSDVREFADQP